MKFFGLIVVAVCLGTCSAGMVTSAVFGTVDFVSGGISSVINAPVNIATGTASFAVQVAESAIKAVSSVSVNTGINVFLFEVRSVVKATGNKNIAIPGVATNLGLIKFSADGGFFRDISSLTQAGSANVSMKGMSILIDIPISLHEIETGYEHFKVSMLNLKAGGGLKIHVAKDTFVIRLVLKPGLTCALNLQKVEVSKFDGIDIDFINMGSKSEWVLEKCSRTIIKFMKETIKKQIQDAIDTNVKLVLKENGSICSKFLG